MSAIVYRRFRCCRRLLADIDEADRVPAGEALLDRTMNLVEESIDLAVRIGHLPDTSLIATKIGEVRRAVCASPSYLAARNAPRDPEDLGNHELIEMTAMGAFGNIWSFAHAAPQCQSD